MQNIKNNQQNKGTGEKVRDFIRYNNTVPLFVAIGIVVSGSAFAATPTGQEAISNTLVGQQEKVVSVDNTLISSIDLASWSPKIRVTGMTEDVDNYYVSYTLSTIDIVDFKWQYTDKIDTLKVTKDVLKDYTSLSDYVKFQLKQNIDAENERLARTQTIERKNITLKQTVTSYSGLAGLVLDENTSVEPPVAVIPDSNTPGIPSQQAQQPETQPQTIEQPAPQSENQNPSPTPVQTSTPTSSTSTESTTTSTTTQPIIDTSVIDSATSSTSSTTTPTEASSSSPTPEPVPASPATTPATTTDSTTSSSPTTTQTASDTPVTTTQ